MATQQYTIGAREADAALAGRVAEELFRVLREIEALDVRLVRADRETMDFGSAVHVLAASPTAAEKIMRVLAEWLRRNPSCALTVHAADGTRSLSDAASFGPELAGRITEVGAGSRLNKVINAEGNVVTSTGGVSGIAPVEPWPEPKQSRK